MYRQHRDACGVGIFFSWRFPYGIKCVGMQLLCCQRGHGELMVIEQGIVVSAEIFRSAP